jgi:hypothetical protein
MNAAARRQSDCANNSERTVCKTDARHRDWGAPAIGEIGHTPHWWRWWHGEGRHEVLRTPAQVAAARRWSPLRAAFFAGAAAAAATAAAAAAKRI